jgi:hypothetical protein
MPRSFKASLISSSARDPAGIVCGALARIGQSRSESRFLRKISCQRAGWTRAVSEESNYFSNWSNIFDLKTGQLDKNSRKLPFGKQIFQIYH